MLERASMPSTDSIAASRCQHCGALAIVEPHAALGFRCAVCGGPRLALAEPGLELGAAAQSGLKNAGQQHTRYVALSAAGFSLLGLGALALLVATGALLAAAPGLMPTLLTLAACSVPLGAGLWALSAAAAARRQRAEALHSARVGAVSDAQAALGALDASRVSELLRIDAEQAELLLAEASVSALLEQVAVPRVRVDAETASTALEEPAAEAGATDVPLTRKGTEIR
jgi:hypothetical protein